MSTIGGVTPLISRTKVPPMMPKCRTDMDVIISIGILHWRIKMKRYEIPSFLRARCISLFSRKHIQSQP